ncbi:hypothetical protein SAMN05443633_101603 [Chryseobacterium arachidis]|uniref:Uncharacterized protein n=1 Tax=Chryseobacterium arachidis TaxID=1416778 RepID=A0A1M4UUX7_9FLAO|nr:hypothetical protein [Chryseobacterium arachidis]SHE60400.1 hypothetical protein SAMN05443633_101603 [Chryseobacterium arachidis]
MKLLFPILLLCSGLVFSQKAVPHDYKKIPEILDNTDLLYPFIVPDKKYNYWSVLRNNPDPDKAIIYESQTPDFMTINDPAPEKGFFQKCLGEDCFSYVIACENSQSKYFSNEQQLRSFIGFVDNLPEAILIANTYGYTVDSTSPLSSSYKIDDSNISLYLSKTKNCPLKKESFIIKMNRKTGKSEVKSNGIYFKSEECKKL